MDGEYFQSHFQPFTDAVAILMAALPKGHDFQLRVPGVGSAIGEWHIRTNSSGSDTAEAHFFADGRVLWFDRSEPDKKPQDISAAEAMVTCRNLLQKLAEQAGGEALAALVPVNEACAMLMPEVELV